MSTYAALLPVTSMNDKKNDREVPHGRIFTDRWRSVR